MPRLTHGVVQVWCASLRGEDVPIPSEPGKQLCAEELHRASRFKAGELRERFIRSRLILRRILAGCLGRRPESLRFGTLHNGKPILVNDTGLDYNLAHSGDLLLLAAGLGRPLGVDVERIRPLRHAQGVADRFFTRREALWLGQTKSSMRPQAFFRCWTRKEAVLKATGEGISGGLREVELLDVDNGFLETVDREANPRTSWKLTELEPALGYVGALATSTEDQGRELRRMCFQGA